MRICFFHDGVALQVRTHDPIDRFFRNGMEKGDGRHVDSLAAYANVICSSARHEGRTRDGYFSRHNLVHALFYDAVRNLPAGVGNPVTSDHYRQVEKYEFVFS